MDAAALLRVLAPERARFVGLARRRVQNDADAEDMVQRALTRAAQRAEALRDPARARPWFYRILRHTIADHHRAGVHDPARQPGGTDPETLAAPGDHDALAPRATCACGVALLSELHPSYGEVLRRLDLNGEDPAEVAAALGISVGNLYVRLHRARHVLRDRVKVHCGVSSMVPCLDCTCSGNHRCAHDS